MLVIGSAAGGDIAKTVGARYITGIELNPVTISLLENCFADNTGRLPEDDRIKIIHAEARSYLRRDDSRYDVI